MGKPIKKYLFTISLLIVVTVAICNLVSIGSSIVGKPRTSAPVDKFIRSFGPEHLSMPYAITHDAEGNIYIIDSLNDRVKVFSWKGPLQSLWGETGSGNGQFITPQGIAVDNSGFVYVADTGNHRIQVFTETGDFKEKWNSSSGAPGSGDGEFNFPRALAINSTGAVYVSDVLNYRIQVFNSDGKFLFKWGSQGSDDGEFMGPVTMAINSTGHVYVADTYNHRIQVFDKTGNFLFKWGTIGSGDGEFQLPTGMAINATNDLVFVADNYNRRIQVFSQVGVYQYQWNIPGEANIDCFTTLTVLPSPLSIFVLDAGYGSVTQYTLAGTPIITWSPTIYSPGHINNPTSIAINASGYLYLTSMRTNRVQVFSPTGQYLFQWNQSIVGHGIVIGEFDYPQGIAINATGHVYVVDSWNHRIQVFDHAGHYKFMWNKSTGGYGTGDGEFTFPTGIAINTTGHVFVTDTGNHRVQVFDQVGHFLFKINKTDGGSGSGEGEFNNTQGITTNTSGHIFVVDQNNNRVQVFDNAGHFLYMINKTGGGSGSGDGEFLAPWGITTNSSGHVFVTDVGNSRIQVFDPSGHFLYKWGSLGRGNGQFKGPAGIAINSTGNVYVTDYAYDKVQVFGNTAPEATSLKISPAKPTTADALALDYEYSDVDGDPEYQSQICWYRNSVLQVRLNNLRKLTPDLLQANDDWYFTLQPYDGVNYGDLVTSSPVTVTQANPFMPFIVGGVVVSGAVGIVGLTVVKRRHRVARKIMA